MTLPSVVPDVDEKRKTFFRTLFGPAVGMLCIAMIEGENKSSYEEKFFRYPEELDQAIDFVNRNLENNLYFCSQLFGDKQRKKGSVEATPNVWADLDHCEPENMLVEPTIVLESSPGRFQAFWVLDGDFDPDDVENTAKRIAYRHASEGADKSGWDLTQLLRIPYTLNYKYDDAPQVKPVSAKRLRYKLEDFDKDYPQVEEYMRITIPKPEIPDDINADDLLQNASSRINPTIWGLFNDTPEESTWSERLWRLMLLLFENEFGPEQVFVISKAAACNKYLRDGRPQIQLWKDVCRAHMRVELADKIAFGKTGYAGTERYDLMTEDERDKVLQEDDTFIERYINWASSLGDAAVQYHQAGAFVALSSVLCGSIRLPTSYGVIVPNLWFMILADTTLTRKSTAMDICTDLLEEIDDNVIMATDGSIEGLMTALSTRPNRPSIFLRDEFSGLVDQMNKKDYMAGMAELFTKLYDGKMQRRQLRKETIEIKSPRLIIFGGGIRNATTAAMSTEMISSGFVPRFIFITAESDINRVKPIGPPTVSNIEERNRVGSELLHISEFYNRDLEVMIPGTDTVVKQKAFFDVELTADAWKRYNDLERKLTLYGINSDRPEVYTPVGDRLAKSILKAAVLLTAARHLTDNIVVEEIDLLRAIYYGEKWFMHTRAVVNTIGIGTSERNLHAIVKRIAEFGASGVSRSEVMRNFRLNSREFSQIGDTLEQRGLVSRTRVGRGEMLRIVSDADLRFLNDS